MFSVALLSILAEPLVPRWLPVLQLDLGNLACTLSVRQDKSAVVMSPAKSINQANSGVCETTRNIRAPCALTNVHALALAHPQTQPY